MGTVRRVGFALLACLALASNTASAQTAGLAAGCDGAAIQVTFSGTYPAEAVPFAFVWRRDASTCGPWTAVTGIMFFPPGQPQQFEVVDRDVLPEHLYHYTLALDPAAPNPPRWEVFLPIVYDAYAGCGAAPVAFGVVRTQPWDEWISFPIVPSCPGTCYPAFIVYSSAVDLSPYVGRDVPVALFGTIVYAWQWGWVLFVNAAEPRECATLGVEAVSWGRAKQLYRDATR